MGIILLHLEVNTFYKQIRGDWLELLVCMIFGNQQDEKLKMNE